MEELIFSNLGDICCPAASISKYRVKNKWCSYNYETNKISGTMLVSVSGSSAADVVISPKASGWYKIFVGLYGFYCRETEINMKLSDDLAFSSLSPCLECKYSEHFVEDVFWRCADMTGQDIIIGKHLLNNDKDACIAWVRLVPMTDKEINDYTEDNARSDTKRLYLANDMHNKLCFEDMSDKKAWLSVVEAYKNTDAEWLAIEDLYLNQGKLDNCSFEDFAFANAHDRNFYGQFEKNYDSDVLKLIVARGHEFGIKMAVSLRVAFWGAEYPCDLHYFEKPFGKQHPEYRCIDRDGDVTEYFSFAYTQVQDYIIEQFVNAAKSGCDAIQPLFSRGWPFILFEEPFLTLFSERYGEDARVLPLDDPRTVELKCEIMTAFMRRLRKRIDEVSNDKRIEIHAKVLFSVYDNRLVGLDLEAWAREGLVDRIISDQRRIREVLDDSVWQDDSQEKIDLTKYKSFIRSYPEQTIQYDYDYIFPPCADSKGVLKGPETQQQRIAEFMELENKYGMVVYIEIMPREMSPEEIKERALEIYNCGCGHIGLWDTNSRVVRTAEWTMWRRIGHKDELASYSSGQNELFKKVRLLKFGNKNVRSYKPLWGG